MVSEGKGYQVFDGDHRNYVAWKRWAEMYLCTHDYMITILDPTLIASERASENIHIRRAADKKYYGALYFFWKSLSSEVLRDKIASDVMPHKVVKDATPHEIWYHLQSKYQEANGIFHDIWLKVHSNPTKSSSTSRPRWLNKIMIVFLGFFFTSYVPFVWWVADFLADQIILLLNKKRELKDDSDYARRQMLYVCGAGYFVIVSFVNVCFYHSIALSKRKEKFSNECRLSIFILGMGSLKHMLRMLMLLHNTTAIMHLYWIYYIYTGEKFENYSKWSLSMFATTFLILLSMAQCLNVDKESLDDIYKALFDKLIYRIFIFYSIQDTLNSLCLPLFALEYILSFTIQSNRFIFDFESGYVYRDAIETKRWHFCSTISILSNTNTNINTNMNLNGNSIMSRQEEQEKINRTPIFIRFRGQNLYAQFDEDPFCFLETTLQEADENLKKAQITDSYGEGFYLFIVKTLVTISFVTRITMLHQFLLSQMRVWTQGDTVRHESIFAAFALDQEPSLLLNNLNNYNKDITGVARTRHPSQAVVPSNILEGHQKHY